METDANAGAVEPKAPARAVRGFDNQMRRYKAMQLRSARLTYQQIADRLYNGDKGNCYRDIKRGLAAIEIESVDEVRAAEIGLLDQMARPFIKKAIEYGDTKAAEVVLKIMERRSKYLGLDAPETVHQFGAGEITVLTHGALAPAPMAEPEVVIDEPTG